MAQIIAIHQTERIDEKGMRVGPIIIFDPDTRTEIGNTEWMREDEARRYAEERGWRFKAE